MAARSTKRGTCWYHLGEDKTLARVREKFLGQDDPLHGVKLCQ